MKRRLLALSWAMPPMIYPRSLQVARTLKALSERGWDVSVITVCPEAEPHSVKDIALEKFYEKSFRRVTVETREEVTPSALWLRLWRRYYPPKDIYVANWVRRARKVVMSELSRNRHDVLVTFAQPWADHVIGARIKQWRPGLPWLAHFSDPWTDSPYYIPGSSKERKKTLVQEKIVIRNADSLVFVTRETKELVMRKYSTEWLNKTFSIPHGYDESLLSLLSGPTRSMGKMRITHAGNFYPRMREPMRFLDALAKLVKDPQIRSSILVEFIGYASEECVSYAKALGVDDVVVFRGKASFIDSLAALRDSDLLLLIDAPAENNVFLPSKIADYLMVRTPILGLTPVVGPSADLLRRLGYAVISPTDPMAICRELAAAFRRWQKGERVVAPEHLEVAREFDIDSTTNAFEKALNFAMQCGRNTTNERWLRLSE